MERRSRASSDAYALAVRILLKHPKVKKSARPAPEAADLDDSREFEVDACGTHKDSPGLLEDSDGYFRPRRRADRSAVTS